MSELQKAMVSYDNTGQGQNLLAPEYINPLIFEKLQEEFPLMRLTPKEQARAPQHQYRVRSVMPDAWVQGELAEADFSSATYINKTVDLKIVRTWNGVSGFMQQLSQRFVNALEEAIETSILGFANTLEWLTLYGNTADTYQFSGLMQQMIADSTAKANNILDLASAPVTLSHLDSAIDAATKYTRSSEDQWAFMMSRPMISRISGLQTRVTRDVPVMEYEGGFVMTTYRGIPLLPSNLLVPAASTTSPAATAAAAAGGTLADDEYFYVIASVTAEGEQLPGTEDSATTATTNNSVTLTWTGDANAKNYVIYRGLATGVHEYLTTIPAKSYTDGKVSGLVQTFTDDGSYTPVSTVKPLTTGDEQIVLANISRSSRGNRFLGSVSPLGDPIDEFVSYVPLATVNSAYRFMIESFLAYKVPYPVTNFVIRNGDLS